MDNDTPDTPENKVNDVSYDEDRLKFFLACFDEGWAHVQSLMSRVEENRKFFDGKDDILDKRAANKDVKMSALFINQLRPAIDTRIATVMDRADGDNLLVHMQVNENVPDNPDLNALILKKEEELNQLLRDSGYWPTVWERNFKASEIQPYSIVKIFKDTRYSNVPSVAMPPDPSDPANAEAIQRHFNKYKTMPPMEPTTKWDYGVASDDITVEWRDHDEVFFDPCKSLKYVRYWGEPHYMTWDELLEFAVRVGFDMNAVQRLKDNPGAGDLMADNTMAEKSEKSLDYTRPKAFKDGKYLVVELWYKWFNPQSKIPAIKKMYVGGNKEILKDDFSEYPGFDFPYVLKVAWPRLGTIEGDSTVDIGRALQRIYSDIYNAIMDICSYGIHSPLLVDDKVTFKEQLQRYPGVIWYCSDPDKVKFMEIPFTGIQELLILLQTVSAALKQLLNCPDIDQGVQEAQDQEKATKTRLRAAGAARRLRSILKAAENDILAVAGMIMSIKQQDDPTWILPVKLHVPILSGVYTPDEELIQSQSNYSIAQSSPLYASPMGLLKLRTLFEDVLNKSRVKDIDSRLMTKEELEATNIIMTQIQQLADELKAQTEDGQRKPANNLQEVPNGMA